MVNPMWERSQIFNSVPILARTNRAWVRTRGHCMHASLANFLRQKSGSFHCENRAPSIVCGQVILGSYSLEQFRRLPKLPLASRVGANVPPTCRNRARWIAKGRMWPARATVRWTSAPLKETTLAEFITTSAVRQAGVR